MSDPKTNKDPTSGLPGTFIMQDGVKVAVSVEPDPVETVAASAPLKAVPAEKPAAASVTQNTKEK